MSTNLEDMQQTRHRLAALRRDLRDAERDLEHARAMAEATVIERAREGNTLGIKALGANAEERARVMVLSLAKDEIYIAAATAESMCRDELEQCQAELDCLRDERTERRLRIMERLIDLLESERGARLIAGLGAMS